MLVNFRDIQAQNSKESGLKKNIFFRGGQLTDLTAEDKKILTNKFQIGKIYDFRGQEEVTTQPDVELKGIKYENKYDTLYNPGVYDNGISTIVDNS